MTARFAIARAEGGGLDDLVAEADQAARRLRDRADVQFAKSWYGFPFGSGAEGNGPDLRMAAVSVLGRDRDALSATWDEDTAGLTGVERFDIEAEAVRVKGTAWGGQVPTATVASLDEPVLVVIAGDLYPEHVAAFIEAGRHAVTQAVEDPAYLGGCALVSASMLDITSFSCWRSARDARRYAFGAGAHKEAKDADQSVGWHDQETAFFASFRVLSSSGTLLGVSPFAEGARSFST